MTDSASAAASDAAAADEAPAKAEVTTQPGGRPVYWERLYLPWYHWLLPLFAAGLLAAEVNMGYPGVRAWLPYVITIPLTLLILWRFGSAKVEVRDGELWVGDAHLPLRYAGETQIIPGNLKRQVLGPAFDPAAFALHRSWVGPMVWIHVTDEADPTPYWLVSTRHPERLVAAIEAGRPAPQADDDESKTTD
ncbi:MAG TPA: DUF3093 domain-containing protein [Pseudonocardiaceae bacterium]|nr:DUF3093 domain-containing protein [Pseudonocardiaceae bacterium]